MPGRKLGFKYKDTTKFMLVLETVQFRRLEALAKRRSITIQELLRAVVVPDWMEARRVREAVQSEEFRRRVHRLQRRRRREREK